MCLLIFYAECTTFPVLFTNKAPQIHVAAAFGAIDRLPAAAIKQYLRHVDANRHSADGFLCVGTQWRFIAAYGNGSPHRATLLITVTRVCSVFKNGKHFRQTL